MGALIAVYALLVLGLLLCFVGRFPGQVLAYAGMLVAAFALHNHDYPVWMLILCGVLVVGSILVNILVAPKLAAKVQEFGKAGKWGTIVGSIISLFCIAATENKVVALIIFILLPFLFAFLFEWISRKKAGEGAKRAVGAYTLFAGTTFINLLVAAFISIEVFYGWDNFLSDIKLASRTESRRDRKDADRDWDDEDEDEVRDRKSEDMEQAAEEAAEAMEEAVVEIPSTGDVFACGFDGFVNMRKSPSFSAPKAGIFKNGPVGATLLEDLGEWKKIDYEGQVGYVHSNYLQSKPTVAYAGTVSGDWVSGAWSDGSSFLYLYNNGTWVQGTGTTPSSYGLFYMQNNEVKLTPVLGTFSPTLPIDQAENKLGDYVKSAAAGDQYRALRMDFNKVVAQQRTHGSQNLLVDTSSSPSESVSSDSGSRSVPSSSNVDQLLNEYEKCVNQMIALLKRIENDDLSAYERLESVTDRAEAIAERLDDLEDGMTMAQAERYAKIHLKMINSVL